MFAHCYLASEVPVTDSTARRPAAPGTPLRDLARAPGGAERQAAGKPPSPRPQPPGSASAINRAAAASIQPGKGDPPWPP
jgi:hypothetical protein